MKPMKILAAGCIHGNSTLIESLAEQAEKENVDLVVLAGDLTLGERSTDNILGPFVKRGRKVALVPGNHETIATADFLAKKYGAVNLHGYGFNHGEIGLFGCGGANIGLFQLSEDEIFYHLYKSHRYVKDAKKRIMVTHVHPAESLMEQFSDFVKGSTGVTKAIELLKPDIMLCSHVHEASGLEETIGGTRIINVSRTGKIIEV
ncbi:metallophosphoesterase family protein [Candidatus Woesearchaeota archaeon]|nr:metallophosphoesterase family protein [Candidatus Woesearchaeota archaeon]